MQRPSKRHYFPEYESIDPCSVWESVAMVTGAKTSRRNVSIETVWHPDEFLRDTRHNLFDVFLWQTGSVLKW